MLHQYKLDFFGCLFVRFAIRYKIEMENIAQRAHWNELAKWATLLLCYSTVTIECMRMGNFNCFLENARQNFVTF